MDGGKFYGELQRFPAFESLIKTEKFVCLENRRIAVHQIKYFYPQEIPLTDKEKAAIAEEVSKKKREEFLLKNLKL